MCKCKHCGKSIEPQDVYMNGLGGRWRHADYPRTEHCIIDDKLMTTSAAPEE